MPDFLATIGGREYIAKMVAHTRAMERLAKAMEEQNHRAKNKGTGGAH